ncbi:MAG: class I SAM-dependent methyltransferase [Oscillospiraceae bacterium]|jgi:SAM-dependent methyltransferase|nr:class I SAM-dependent methyltransferase [Oscillospiraceae bacterium]
MVKIENISTNKTGWERKNRVHFDSIVATYDKIRWDYPDEIFSDIFEYCGSNASKRAIEIGAGTGKATEPFLDAGYDVTAVELGANMSAFLKDKYKKYKGFSVITSSFEDASLEDDSYDLIYSASAFHWVDASVGCPKVMNLLKDNSVFALFRNNASQQKDELYDEVQLAYNKHYYSHYMNSKRPIDLSEMTVDDFLQPLEVQRGFRFDSLEQYGFRDVVMKLYKASCSYTAEDYIQLLDTYSDNRALPDDSREKLYHEIKNAIIKHGGHQKLNFIFQLYMGRK